VRRQGLELVTRYLQPGFAEERTRFSQVPGEPRLSVCTCSHPTPAGLLAPDRCSAAAWPLNALVQRLPRLGLSTLNSMAFGLAVYASQCGLLQHHARLASSCWSGSTGRAFHPQGSVERFQSCRLHLILLSQACLAQRACHMRATGFRLGAHDDHRQLGQNRSAPVRNRHTHEAVRSLRSFHRRPKSKRCMRAEVNRQPSGCCCGVAPMQRIFDAIR
jgi:hypothetical protein